ncbi:MAG: hypothetical protein IJP11_02320 [Oscillospiraceae bacterium]|nr:hypothetical protein [Oscillospiraceae bacterium]
MKRRSIASVLYAASPVLFLVLAALLLILYYTVPVPIRLPQQCAFKIRTDSVGTGQWVEEPETAETIHNALEKLVCRRDLGRYDGLFPMPIEKDSYIVLEVYDANDIRNSFPNHCGDLVIWKDPRRGEYVGDYVLPSDNNRKKLSVLNDITRIMELIEQYDYFDFS